ncbi:MAG: XRE family transcriptional regulator [Pseudomonadota bacterium]
MPKDPHLVKALLGQDIRALRSARKMTLEDLSERLGRSVGWLSQVERDISSPSIDDLRHIAKLLNVPISIFFGTSEVKEEERGLIVRAQARRAIGDDRSGLIETLLSPDLTDEFEVVHSTFLAGTAIEEAIIRPTTEVAYLVSGQLDLWIEDRAFTIGAGDSFRIRGSAFRWANPYSDPAIAIWVISPPVY